MSQDRAPTLGIVCDFDGTIVEEDLGNLVGIAFGGRERWEHGQRAIAAGEWTLRRLLSELFRVRAADDDLRAFALAHAHFRRGFERFARACAAARAPLVVASGGLEVYVRAALAMLPGEIAATLEVRANRGRRGPDGVIDVEFPGAGAGCPRCGSCKGGLVDELRARGCSSVVVVGDGYADFCAAERADRVFARRELERFCRERGIASAHFDDFDSIGLALFGESPPA